MVARTYSRYTAQEIATFARSYRKHEFLAVKDQLFRDGRLSELERTLLLDEIETRFEMTVALKPGYEYLLLIWPTGETAFLALAGC